MFVISDLFCHNCNWIVAFTQCCKTSNCAMIANCAIILQYVGQTVPWLHITWDKLHFMAGNTNYANFQLLFYAEKKNGPTRIISVFFSHCWWLDLLKNWFGRFKNINLRLIWILVWKPNVLDSTAIFWGQLLLSAIYSYLPNMTKTREREREKDNSMKL